MGDHLRGERNEGRGGGVGEGWVGRRDEDPLEVEDEGDGDRSGLSERGKMSNMSERAKARSVASAGWCWMVVSRTGSLRTPATTTGAIKEPFLNEACD